VTTGLVRFNLLGRQSFDGLGGAPVHFARGRVVVVVTEVGADDEQGFFAPPEKVEHLFDCGWSCVADDEGDELETFAESFLEKWKVDFEAVLPAMGFVECDNLGQFENGRNGSSIDGDEPEWCLEGGGATGGQTVERDEMGGAKVDDAADEAALTGKGGEG